VKKISHNFLCSQKFHKIVNYFSFEVPKKNIWDNFQRIIEVFIQKIVNKLSKIWVWYPGSEIRDPEKTYPGSRGQKGTGSGSATLPYIFFCLHQNALEGRLSHFIRYP
jgi:hypothetical protein